MSAGDMRGARARHAHPWPGEKKNQTSTFVVQLVLGAQQAARKKSELQGQEVCAPASPEAQESSRVRRELWRSRDVDSLASSCRQRRVAASRVSADAVPSSVHACCGRTTNACAHEDESGLRSSAFEDFKQAVHKVQVLAHQARLLSRTFFATVP